MPQLLKLGAAQTVPGGAVLLESADIPKQKVPGNRPSYTLVFVAADGKRTSFRFDPFDSGKSFHFGGAEFRLLTNPDDARSLLIEASKVKAKE
jgi:hypothetical protein